MTFTGKDQHSVIVCDEHVVVEPRRLFYNRDSNWPRLSRAVLIALSCLMFSLRKSEKTRDRPLALTLTRDPYHCRSCAILFFSLQKTLLSKTPPFFSFKHNPSLTMSTADSYTSTGPSTPTGGDDSTLYYKAVGSIALYFTTVISALVICIARTRFTASNALYILIAVSSLFITWYYILSFFQKEYVTLGSDLNRFILESDLL